MATGTITEAFLLNLNSLHWEREQRGVSARTTKRDSAEETRPGQSDRRQGRNPPRDHRVDVLVHRDRGLLLWFFGEFSSFRSIVWLLKDFEFFGRCEFGAGWINDLAILRI